MKIALIGLGAIGVPIAHKLNNRFADSFILIADEGRKRKLLDKTLFVNDETFSPKIVSENDATVEKTVDLLIVCVKNYGLSSILRNISPFINKDTVILPLQNGIYSYGFFRDHFPQNIILRGYVQGPNTEKTDNGFKYDNPGELHVGCEGNSSTAKTIVDTLSQASIPIFFEDDIVKMVWKKWMLNVAGNSITALTGADYSLFKLYANLQIVCRKAMEEFRNIAWAENILLEESDIDDIIQYYVTYVGVKKTSMLMDVINERKTENDYLAGKALQLAEKHGIEVPIISTLYYLMEVKEEVYMEKKGCRATGLYTEGVEYSDAMRIQMNDLDRKMKDPDYIETVKTGVPEGLKSILQYATANSEFYSDLTGSVSLQDFPVMDKVRIKANYNRVMVHSFDRLKTHTMYTSGSTGMPFSVIQDLAKRERNIADLKYFGKLAGYSDHDPMCYLRARPSVTPQQQEKDNIWQLDSSSLSEKNLDDYFHVIVEKKCTALIGYASTLRIAVEYWSRNFSNETSITTIISTSEELPTTTRNDLKSFFGDSVKIYARYSNSEQGILGQETGNIGEYKLNWASYYFEILKMENDDPADEGEIGRVIVTDLYNQAFPMIRYDTGDTGRFINRRGELPILTDLRGRQMDIIYDVFGEPVSPFLLARTMRHCQEINQWQFIQESKNRYILRVSFDGATAPNIDDEICELKKTLGRSSQISVEQMENDAGNIAERRKLIVSHVDNK